MSQAPALVAAYKKNADPETRKAVIQALFLAGDSHDLVELARAEKDPRSSRRSCSNSASCTTKKRPIT